MLLRDGADITIISSGYMVSEAIDIAESMWGKGISVRVINMHTLSTIDKEIIYKAIDETEFVCTLEDHNIVGGLGSAVAEVVAECGKSIKFKRFGLNGFTVGYGPYEDLKEKNGIGKKSVQRRIEDWMA